jgi:hypothetical protein
MSREGGAGAIKCAIADRMWKYDLNPFFTFKRRRWLQVMGPDTGPESVLELKRSLAKDPVGLDNLSYIFNSSNIMARLTPQNGLIDFAGPGRKVYQVTLGLKHKMNLATFRRVLIEVGYLAETDNSLVLAQNAPQEKLEFYWVAPVDKWLQYDSSTRDLESLWKLKTPYVPDEKGKKGLGQVELAMHLHNKAIVRECIEKYVDQYVIVLRDRVG